MSLRLPTLLLFVSLVGIARTQSFTCSCTCCLGSGCQVALLGQATAQECSDTACATACRARFYQCPSPSTAGQTIGVCTTTTTASYVTVTGGPYGCRCSCCNTGTPTCPTTYVGEANAYSCHEGACSIACANKYPYICVNNYSGQTQGQCSGAATPTPPTVAGFSRCGCSCRTFSGNQNYEVPGNGCSACPSACAAVQLQCIAGTYQNIYCIGPNGRRISYEVNSTDIAQ